MNLVPHVLKIAFLYFNAEHQSFPLNCELSCSRLTTTATRTIRMWRPAVESRSACTNCSANRNWFATTEFGARSFPRAFRRPSLPITQVGISLIVHVGIQGNIFISDAMRARGIFGIIDTSALEYCRYSQQHAEV